MLNYKKDPYVHYQGPLKKANKMVSQNEGTQIDPKYYDPYYWDPHIDSISSYGPPCRDGHAAEWRFERIRGPSGGFPRYPLVL